MSQQSILPKGINLPNHVALICDGNRRWARARGLNILEGHKAGGERIKEIARACRKFGIHTFTVWVFSTENWSRGEEAIKTLKLIEQAIDSHIEEAKRDKVRVIHLGRKDRLPKSLLKKIENAEAETKNNNKYIFNIAIDYGGHDEIIRAVNEIIKNKVKKVAEKTLSSYLDTADQPFPYIDLLIRTSGEQRLSGFMPWQLEYSEIWWEENLLPDFTEERFTQALLDYSRRNRRFGGTSGKLHKFEFKPQLVAKLELDWWRAKRFQNRDEFISAFTKYAKEQFNISLALAKEAAEIFIDATVKGEQEKNWEKTKKILTRFYKLLKQNIKIAFEPKIVAGLEVEYIKSSTENKNRTDLASKTANLYAELFRLPLLQANKVAHLRLLAREQQDAAEHTEGPEKDRYKKQAEEYLTMAYQTLKERVS